MASSLLLTPPRPPSTDTWDPKITTPPGLYLVGTLLLWAVGKAQALVHGAATAPDLCAPGQPILPYLRPINAAFNVGTFVLVYRLLYRTRKVRTMKCCGTSRLFVGFQMRLSVGRRGMIYHWIACSSRPPLEF